MPELNFWIDAANASSHELSIRVRLESPSTSEVAFFLPTWTPGSYLIRDYARHLSRVEAYEPETEQRLDCRKSSKNRFIVSCPGAKSIELRYRVYCHELSVRTAHIDASHAFWNHACTLLWPLDHCDLGACISVNQAMDTWLFCSLNSSGEHIGETNVTKLYPADLDDALDAPVLITSIATANAANEHCFKVDDVDHFVVLDGLAPVDPPESLCADLQAIVKQTLAVFGGKLPYEEYHWLSLFTDEGYGGLEHRDSSVLLMPRTALTSDRGYRDFLALAAHELFHAWNVKRMRPAEFWNYDYENENYTKFLWLMEGWTAYYDDLLVVRAGLMSHSDYLATMAKNVQNMLSAPGRLELSLEESSFDAWIRLYKPDENTRNSSQNYYGNGAVAAMCLDLTIRQKTNGAQSLDDVLRKLYQSTFGEGRAYEICDVERILEDIAGRAVIDQLHELVKGALDPQLDALLESAGVEIRKRDAGKPFLGVGFRAGSTMIASITKGGPAAAAGIAPGDELLAIHSLRITSANWKAVFHAVARCDEAVEILLSRRGVVQSLSVTPEAGNGTCKLIAKDGATDSQRRTKTAWLGHEAVAATPAN